MDSLDYYYDELTRYRFLFEISNIDWNYLISIKFLIEERQECVNLNLI